jgi:hypothetical protein
MLNDELSDEYLNVLEERSKMTPVVISCCGEYHCDCHEDIPKLLKEIQRLRSELYNANYYG